MNYYKPEKPKEMEHVVVYRNNNEFCSWPFNAGMWKVNNKEVLVAFMNIQCDYTNKLSLNHNRVETFGRIASARTKDGGRTWAEPTTLANNWELNDKLKFGSPSQYTKPLDFTTPNTLMAVWSTPNSGDSAAGAWYMLSEDSGETWGDAVLLPKCNIPRFQGRPSYLVRPDGVILLFLTARPVNNPNDRPVVYASYDGGCNWSLMSFLPNSTEYRMICPSPVLMEDGSIVVAVRCKLSMESAWNEIFRSEDGGRNWTFVSRVNDHGDTVHLTRMEDGRLIVVYGYRRPPFGIRARISEDQGKTWGPELILRDDGGSNDLGYPRVVELEKGRIFAAYYINEKNDPIQMNGGVRYIGGTLLQI